MGMLDLSFFVMQLHKAVTPISSPTFSDGQQAVITDRNLRGSDFGKWCQNLIDACDNDIRVLGSLIEACKLSQKEWVDLRPHMPNRTKPRRHE